MSLVELTDIRKRFGAVEVLKGISLTLEKGEIVAVIGRSGSGKSTMLRCINGLEKVQSGRIVVDGIDVTAPKRRSQSPAPARRHGVPELQSVPASQCRAQRHAGADAGAKARQTAAASEVAREVVAKVGLADKLLAYPDELSGGQQQRVAIARSLAMQPTLMLFDEITSALDPELVGEVLRVLEGVASEGMTMMLVTHEMNFAKNVADRVIFMHEGRIHEDGPARETLLEPRTAELRSFLSAVLH